MDAIFLLLHGDDVRLMSMEHLPFVDGFSIGGIAIDMFDYRRVRVRGKQGHSSEAIQSK